MVSFAECTLAKNGFINEAENGVKKIIKKTIKCKSQRYKVAKIWNRGQNRRVIDGAKLSKRSRLRNATVTIPIELESKSKSRRSKKSHFIGC